MSRKALLIGVGNYDHYPSLTEAVEGDLGRLQTALKNAGVGNVTLLGGGGVKVAAAMLRSAIAAFIQKAAAGADLLVYYTGHGYCVNGVTYLVPSDAVTDLLDKESYLVEVAFDKETSVSAARSVSFVIDACRTPLDERPAAPDEPVRTPGVRRHGRPRTTVVYACAPGEQAVTFGGHHGASLFTQAFSDLVEAAGQGVALSRLKQSLQDKTTETARRAGLDHVPQIDVWPGTELETEPFAFFRPGKSTPSGRRWSGLLSGEAQNLGFSGPSAARFAGLCGVLDEIEAAGPGIDDPLLRVLPDQTLPERLARAATHVLSRCRADNGKSLVSDADRLVVLGVSAALEFAARSAEFAAAERTARQWQDSAGQRQVREQVAHTRLGVIAPQLSRVYPSLPPARQRMLEAWCDRVLSLREAIGKPETLRGALTQLLPQAYGTDLGDSTGDLSRYVIGHLYEEFIGREADASGGGETRRRPQEVLAPTADSDTAIMLDGRLVAALVRLVWLLSADTRLLGPELGLALSQDATSPSESLSPLGKLSWIRAGDQVIDLRLSITSAPLDQALRQLTQEITAFLLGATQPGMPLHGLDLPRAATATRLLPARRDGRPLFRLPHIRFEASAAETTELLMGTNLYGDAHVAVRELYQNAVDACTYREWRIRNAAPSERACGGWRPTWTSEIVFSSGRDTRGAWIECRDNGVGMSEYELRESFAKIGKRFRDLPEFLEETEEWGTGGDTPFGPISQFGIGVLSYFMIASEIELRTTRSDDRHSRFSHPLLVRISDTSGLFRFEKPQGPPSDGTAVRLYLREEFADLDLAGSLQQVIAAPVVRTRLITDTAGHDDARWEPGLLYDENGSSVPAFAVPRLGVYFHDGPGRVLVNGIPLNALGGPGQLRPRLAGVTVSLDARTKPRLSVDRSRLLSVDLPALRDQLIAAAGRVGTWADANVSWLLDLFATDPDVGTVAYGALVAAARDLPLVPALLVARDTTSTASPATKADRVPLSRIGVSVFDPEIGPRPSARDRRKPGNISVGRGGGLRPSAYMSQLAEERQRALWSRDRGVGPGFPAFDARLVRLLTLPRRGLLYGITGNRLTAGDSSAPIRDRFVSRRRPRESSRGQGLPGTWRAVADMASASRISFRSAAVFAWAVRFLSSPAAITVPRLLAAADQALQAGLLSADPADWATDLGLFSMDQSGPLHELALILSASGSLHEHDPVVAAILDTPEANEYVDAYRGLTEEAQDGIEMLLSGSGPWETSDPRVLTEVKNFIAQYLDWITPPELSPDEERAERSAGPPEGLSDPARWAVSRDFDGAAPFYRKDEPIPAILIALAAVNPDDPIDPDDIHDELAQAGYLPTRPDSWDAFKIAANGLRVFAVEGMGDLFEYDGRVALATGLGDLANITMAFGAERIMQIAEALHAVGIDAESTRRIARLGSLRRSDLTDMSAVLDGRFPLEMDVISLVRLAEKRSASLGESLAILLRHRPLSDPWWRLPDRLPPELAARRPSTAELSLIQLASNTDLPDWRKHAVQAAALSGMSLADVGADVSPLLSACGESTGHLDMLCAAWPHRVTFDDLLILGCLETWPDLGAEEIDALCRPSCRWPDDLADRVRRWLNPAANGAQTPADAWRNES